MKINSPIRGMMESSRDYVIDVTPGDGKNTAIGPYPGDTKLSIVLNRGTNSGNAFVFDPTVLSGNQLWPSTQ